MPGHGCLHSTYGSDHKKVINTISSCCQEGQSTVTWQLLFQLELMNDSRVVEDYLQRTLEPQTLDEVARGVELTLSETEASLDQLVSQGGIVCSCVHIEKDATKLYWKENGATKTPISHVLVQSASTPLGGIRPPSRRSTMPFKSPARKAEAALPSTTPLSSRKRSLPGFKRTNRGVGGVERLSSNITKLKERLEEFEKEIEGFVEDYCEEELQVHIDKLHEYNEVKDMGQLLLGKLAEVEGTTTAALYERFGLKLED